MKKNNTRFKDNVIEQYSEDYFNERDYLPEYLLNAIIIFLKEHNYSHILEVGVGTGKLIKALLKEGFNVQGIDISPVAAKLAGVKIGSATSIPFNNEVFDCVLGISIIEHLNKKEGAVFIQEAKRVLKDGGSLFLVTPNYSSPLRYIKKENWFAYKDKTHVYFYTPYSLKDLLSKHGFHNIRRTFKVNSYYIDWPLPKVFYKFPEFLRKYINIAFISTPLAFIRESFWIVGKK